MSSLISTSVIFGSGGRAKESRFRTALSMRSTCAKHFIEHDPLLVAAGMLSS